MKGFRWLGLASFLAWSGLAQGAQGEVEIVHDPIACWPVDEFLMIQSSFVPPEDIQTVKFYFRSTEHPDYYYVELTLGQGAGRAIAPKADPTTSGVTYYIELVTRSFSSFRTEEHDVPVASGSECKRRDPETAYYTGENPDIAIGATRSGVPQMPPGFQSEGISRFMSVTGTQGGTGGGGFSGKTAGIIAGIGGGAGAALLLSGGGGSDPTTTSPLGGITTSSPSSSSTSTATGGVTSTTTTAVGGGASTSSATTTVIGGGSTTTTVVGGPTTTTVVGGSTTTTSVGTSSSTSTVVGGTTSISTSTSTGVTTSTPTTSTPTTTSIPTTSSPTTSPTTSIPTTSNPTTSPTTSNPTTTPTTSIPTTSNPTTSVRTTTSTGAAQLTISKSGSPNPVVVNTTLSYTVSIRNVGSANATGVVMEDTLPSSFGVTFINNANCRDFGGGDIRCFSLSIPAGQAINIVIRGVPRSTGTITNRAAITAGPNLPSTSVNTNVVPPALQSGDSPAPIAVKTFLDIEPYNGHSRGRIVFNDSESSEVTNSSPVVHHVAARPGENRVEAQLLASGTRSRGFWRFDFGGSRAFVPGSLRVDAGQVYAQDERSITFAVGDGSLVRFRYRLADSQSP